MGLQPISQKTYLNSKILKTRVTTFLIFISLLNLYSQDLSFVKKSIFKKSNLEFNLTQNTASLFIPSFRVFHPGINSTLSTQWNKNKKLQLKQDFIAGFFFIKVFKVLFNCIQSSTLKLKF